MSSYHRVEVRLLEVVVHHGNPHPVVGQTQGWSRKSPVSLAVLYEGWTAAPPVTIFSAGTLLKSCEILLRMGWHCWRFVDSNSLTGTEEFVTSPPGDIHCIGSVSDSWERVTSWSRFLQPDLACRSWLCKLRKLKIARGVAGHEDNLIFKFWNRNVWPKFNTLVHFVWILMILSKGTEIRTTLSVKKSNPSESTKLRRVLSGS